MTITQMRVLYNPGQTSNKGRSSLIGSLVSKRIDTDTIEVDIDDGIHEVMMGSERRHVYGTT